ncbi:MAG TPA: DUF5668 domain-containing protein [Flavisolibacter sp.]|jgi:predicted membrane protein|nr:DUF5668 domain-containing protein [Flavisolibacter sp.]
MDQEEFKKEINDRWGQLERKRNHGRIWTGFFLLLVGLLLLIKKMELIIFPSWLFTWPMFFIAIGLFSGIKHRFRGGVWIIALLMGGLFLINEMNPSLRFDRYIGPISIIAVGLVFLFRPKKNRCRNWMQDRRGPFPATEGPIEGQPDISRSEFTADRRDFLDVTAVFGGVKKNILTKSFKGGDIVSFMGGSEIDMTQADFNGTVKIDATNIFGGTKLIVPPTWDVQSEITAIFGGVDDKRQVSGINMDPNKVLILDGTCLFGGIEIRSF